MKRALLLAAALSALSVAPAFAAVSHCPEPYLVKVEGPSADHVPLAGTVLCVKAGTGNTGEITGDGTTTLRGYLKAAGIVGGDGEGRDPSYAVVYHLEVTPFPTTTTTTASPPITTTTTTVRTGTPVTTSTTVAGPSTSPTSPDSPSGSVTPHLGCVTPEGHQYVTNIEQGGCAPTATPTAPTTSTPTSSSRTELPATGTGSSLLVSLGTALLAWGLALLVIWWALR